MKLPDNLIINFKLIVLFNIKRRSDHAGSFISLWCIKLISQDIKHQLTTSNLRKINQRKQNEEEKKRVLICRKDEEEELRRTEIYIGEGGERDDDMSLPKLIFGQFNFLNI